MDKATKIDPIRDRYFKPLEIAERMSNGLFYIAALLSFAALLLDKSDYPKGYSIVQTLFILSVIAVFFINIGVKLYWTPRAEDQRRLDLLSNANNVPLTHEQTSGYYNNNQTDPVRETLKNDSISLASPSESVFFDLAARFNRFLGSFWAL